MFQYIPMLALLVVGGSSLLRGVSVKRQSGQRAWAFGSAKGWQRLVGVGFAISAVTLAVAAAFTARHQPPNQIAAILGAVLCVLGTVILVIAQVQMGRAWRVGIRPDDAPLLINVGLFRYSRNPIFLGMVVLAIGISVTSGQWWSWQAAITFALTCDAQVKFEEAHLSQNFGTSYDAYRLKVRRWL